MIIDINLNEYVKVKLTDYGRKYLKDKWDSYNKEFKGILGEYRPMTEDKDGYVKFQWHELINEFDYIDNSKMPFETNVKIEK